MEHTKQWKELSINHLEGRTAGFFCYGDGGGDEMDKNNILKILGHKNYFDGTTEPFKVMLQAYAPLVWQCRYGGIEIPEQLWEYALSGREKKYSDHQSKDVIDDKEYMGKFANWVKNFEMFVVTKGKVQPGKYRAYAYKQPLHFLS